MNIIELAKEVGAEPNYILLKCEALERFAALVRAEYEAPLKLAEEALESAPIEYDFHGNPMDEDYGKLSNKALAAIREVRAGQDHIANASKAAVLSEREWVDLTDYEIVRLYAESPMCDSEMIDFARAVIAAFKEKNK